MSKARPFAQNTQAKVDKAIRDHLVVEMPYRGGMRICNPYYRAMTPEGEQYVLAWQIEGSTSSGDLPNWRSFHLSELGDVRLLNTTFNVVDQARDELFERVALTEPLCSIDEGSNRFLDREL